MAHYSIDGVEVLGAIKEDLTNPRACWIDGEYCPFGEPHGQFNRRPLTSCTPHGCHKVDFHSEKIGSVVLGKRILEIEEARKEGQGEIKEEMATLLDDSRKAEYLSSIIENIANELKIRGTPITVIRTLEEAADAVKKFSKDNESTNPILIGITEIITRFALDEI